MCQSVQAYTITEGHRYTRWCEQQKHIFMLMAMGKSKIKVPVNSVPGEDPLSGLQKAVFSYTLTWQKERERERGWEKASSLVSLLRQTLIPSGAPPS